MHTDQTSITCPEDLEWESCLLLTGSSNLVPRASATALFLVPPSVLTFERKQLRNIWGKPFGKTNLFLQFSEELLVELPLSQPLLLPQLLKVVLQLPILTSSICCPRVFLVGNHVADVVPKLCVNKHPVARVGSITEGSYNNPKANKPWSFSFCFNHQKYKLKKKRTWPCPP